MSLVLRFFFFKQKTSYEMRISDWSSDVCSSDLLDHAGGDSALAHRFERDPERIVIGGEAFDAIACVAIGFDPCRPGDIAVPDRAVAIGRAGDHSGAGTLDPRARRISVGAQHAHRSEEHTSELQSLMPISN